MNKQKLLELASQLVLAGVTKNDGEIEKISEELAAELRQPAPMIENGDRACAPPPLEKDICGFLKFTDKEISKMPKSFRHTFIAEGKVVFYRKRKRGKLYGAITYEARYRRHGYNISVSAANLEDLKTRFIEALHAKELGAVKIPSTFHEFSMYYFENFRKRKVSQQTMQGDFNRYNNHLKPSFGSTLLRRILPAQCQAVIDNILKRGHGKTATEVYSLLNCIFKTAIAHGIIERNPLAIVVVEQHQREHGKALTVSEEKLLLEKTAGTPYQLMFAIALFTGLRPNEYATARLEGNFIIAVNSKRKNRKVEFKKIPVTPMLRPFLEGVTEIKFYVEYTVREKFKEILPEHKLYDLRTTFYTRCQECGVADVARMEFVGHSLGTLGDTYTDLSDEFLLKEGEKLKY